VSKLLLLGQRQQQRAHADRHANRTHAQPAGRPECSCDALCGPFGSLLCAGRAVLTSLVRLSVLRLPCSCLRATSLSVGSTSVGAGASGKSTLFKQMINIYGKGFPEASGNELDTGSGRVCFCCLRHFLWLTLYLGCCCLSCDIHSERKTYTNIIYNKSVAHIAQCGSDAGGMAASMLLCLS
jgi:hypothetical protein